MICIHVIVSSLAMFGCIRSPVGLVDLPLHAGDIQWVARSLLTWASTDPRVGGRCFVHPCISVGLDGLTFTLPFTSMFRYNKLELKTETLFQYYLIRHLYVLFIL